MAVLEVNLLWEGWTGRDGIDRAQRFQRVYEVLTDDANDDEDTAGGQEARDLGLPGNGDQLKDGSSAYVTDISGERYESPTIWHFTITYETSPPIPYAAESQTFDPFTGESVPTDTAPGPDGQPPAAQRDGNPINWTPQWAFTHEQVQEPTLWDRNGDPILNSAGDPFNPPLMIERSYPLITITKNFPRMTIEKLETFKDSVNNNTWFGRPARTCRMIGIDATPPNVGNGVSYWSVTFRIKVKPGSWDSGVRPGGFPPDTGQGWDVRVADQGFRETGGVPITPPSDGRGNTIPGPYPLDGFGNLLDEDDVTKAYFVTYRIYPEKNWDLLGL